MEDSDGQNERHPSRPAEHGGTGGVSGGPHDCVSLFGACDGSASHGRSPAPADVVRIARALATMTDREFERFKTWLRDRPYDELSQAYRVATVIERRVRWQREAS